jgi:hypothetical protein
MQDLATIGAGFDSNGSQHPNIIEQSSGQKMAADYDVKESEFPIDDRNADARETLLASQDVQSCDADGGDASSCFKESGTKQKKRTRGQTGNRRKEVEGVAFSSKGTQHQRQRQQQHMNLQQMQIEHHMLMQQQQMMMQQQQQVMMGWGDTGMMGSMGISDVGEWDQQQQMHMQQQMIMQQQQQQTQWMQQHCQGRPGDDFSGSFSPF